MKNTVETRVSREILQEPSEVNIGGKTYEVAPPSIGTLMKVSGLISKMPMVDTNADDAISEALRIAKDCGIVADVFATIILGAKKPCRGVFARLISVKQSIEYKKLRNAILYDKTPKELSEILTDILVNRMDVGFFLGISTSLSGINMTKPTKNPTTVPGQL